MTSAVTDYGVLFKKGTTTIAEVINVAPPKDTTPAVEATSHSSGGVREYISTLLTGLSEFQATLNFISDATQDQIRTDKAAGTVAAYSIVLPGGMGTWTGNAIITGFQPAAADAKSPKPLTASVWVQPTGAWTLS